MTAEIIAQLVALYLGTGICIAGFRNAARPARCRLTTEAETVLFSVEALFWPVVMLAYLVRAVWWLRHITVLTRVPLFIGRGVRDLYRMRFPARPSVPRAVARERSAS